MKGKQIQRVIRHVDRANLRRSVKYGLHPIRIPFWKFETVKAIPIFLGIENRKGIRDG